MSRDASITLDWADGTYNFRLAWGQIAELQEKCDAGPFVILSRLTSGAWLIGDISHTIRLGLIGGGLAPVPALKMTRTYVEERPPMESLVTAQLILSAGLMGAPEEDAVKKKLETEKELTPSQTGNYA